MKRRYKLLLIILIGIILTILINGNVVKNKVSLVSLGDGFSLGMTPYKVAGTSFNDYLKEMYASANNLDYYNNEFSQSHLKIHELNEFLEENRLGKFSRIPIKQTLARADLITIAIGVDEFADLSLQDNINSQNISDYIQEINILLKTIREFYDKKIIIIGVYPAYNFDKKDAVEVNKQLRIACGNYDVGFLDVLAISLSEEYYLEQNSYYMNYLAHEKIANIIYSMYNH